MVVYKDNVKVESAWTNIYAKNGSTMAEQLASAFKLASQMESYRITAYASDTPIVPACGRHACQRDEKGTKIMEGNLGANEPELGDSSAGNVISANQGMNEEQGIKTTTRHAAAAATAANI